MLFNSFTFFIFLLLVYTAYRLLAHRGQNSLLLIGSYLFYGWWDVRFLFLIVLQTALDFSGGLVIRHGSIGGKERLTSSLWVILSCFFFVALPWSDCRFSVTDFPICLTDAWTWSSNWTLFAATCLVVLIANLVYPLLQSLPFERKRKLFLFFSIGGNLVILGFFKYYNFFIDNMALILRGFGLDPSLLHLHIILPVGISFYTFQSMSYTIDVYRRKIEPTHRFNDFALFVTFFPHLVAGPIMKAHDLLPQLVNRRQISLDQSIRGLHKMFYGFFIKIIIADGFARTANDVFLASPSSLSWIDVIVGALCFTLQIYGDFFGYSLIALGTANLFGVELMVNFNHPYFASNPSDFWNRWHISLSTWLKEYLYIPLGGNRKGKTTTYRNLMLTMILGGIWHGAAWNFVFWGTYHGLLLCLHRLTKSLWPTERLQRRSWTRILSVLFFFCLTCYGWILFRSQSADQIFQLTSILLFDAGNIHLNAQLPPMAAMAGLPVFLLAEWFGYTRGKSLNEALPLPLWTALYAVIVLLFLSADYAPTQFIYFVF